MSQTVTENLFNHDVSITTTGGVELTVDLSAAPWNRTTIADGWWLQNRTNSAFSARDIYLANRIDEINDDIADIRGGYINSLMSMNNVIYSANDYWDSLPPTIAPSNTSKPAPSNTLTYMTVGEDTDLGTEDISLINDRTCIIQGNLTENSFNQILMNTNGLFYRSVSGDTVNSITGEKIDNYDLLETDTQFSQILDDSTINTPGYWFLHKETSGRPVWTNINALAEYIDNRVNPDGVYIDWSATNILGYDTRILTILPPTENNINNSIDVTDIAYNNNAYLWSDGGWVECQPLMSRTEIEELVFSGSNLPSYDESNAGQVLTVNNEGDGLEWTDKGDVGSANYYHFRNTPILACTGSGFDPISGAGVSGVYAACLQTFGVPSANKVKVDGFYQIKGGMDANGIVPNFGGDPKIQTWIIDRTNSSAVQVNVASLTNGGTLPRSVPIPFSFVTGGTTGFDIGFCTEGTWTATNIDTAYGSTAGNLVINYTTTIIQS